MQVPDWLEFLLADTSALQLVFWIVAITFLIVAIFRAWPFIRDAVKIVDALVRLPPFMARTDADMKAMKHQLENEHDTNLRDDVSEAITISQKSVQLAEGLHGRMDEVERNVAQLAKADIEIRAELENTAPPKEKP